MYASAKVCVVCVRPKTFICVKPSLTECSLSFFHTETTEIHRILRVAIARAWPPDPQLYLPLMGTDAHGWVNIYIVPKYLSINYSLREKEIKQCYSLNSVDNYYQRLYVFL